MKIPTLIRLSTEHHTAQLACGFFAVLGILGASWLLHSHAGTPTVSIEPELGTIAGSAGSVNDTSASGGRTVKFQAVVDHSTPCGWTASPPVYKHIIWIWEENKDSSEINNGGAPYIDLLASQCASLTNVQDSATTIALPSEPQYAAATSGSNCNSGITSNSGSGVGCIVDDNDGSFNQLSTTSIFQQVKQAGDSWRGYQEGMQSNCAQSSGGDNYAFKHNPPAFYTQIRTDCNQYDIPIATIACNANSNQTCATPSNQLTADVANGALPTFSFITPNQNNDMHSAPVLQGDNWLHTYLPIIFNGPNYKAGDTAIFIMWDEGSANTGTSRLIPTTIIAPSIVPGMANATAINNISILKTVQDMLGLTPYLGCASGTPPGNTGSCNSGSNISLKSALNL